MEKNYVELTRTLVSLLLFFHSALLPTTHALLSFFLFKQKIYINIKEFGGLCRPAFRAAAPRLWENLVLSVHFYNIRTHTHTHTHSRVIFVLCSPSGGRNKMSFVSCLKKSLLYIEKRSQERKSERERNRKVKEIKRKREKL